MRLFWVVGESSGDHHAAKLIEELQKTAPEWQHAGMCGTQMKSAGCREVANLKEAALMGLVEVIKHLPRLFKLQKRLIQEIVDWQADVVVLVDFPDFNLNLAKKLRKKSGGKVKVFYYVSPQVWAWRKGRAKTIAQLSDAMAVLFPFETEIYKPHGLEAVFHGHPLAGEVNPSDSIKNLRDKFNLSDGEEAVAVLPGSRKQEVERLLPVQLDAIDRLRKKVDSPIKAIVAKADTVDENLLNSIIGNRQNVMITSDGSYDALAVSKVGLVKSGTSTVEAALIGTPFVVLYKVSGMTYFLGKLLIKGVKHIAMANLLTGREVVPERIQDEANPETLSKDIFDLWSGKKRETMKEGLAEISTILGEPGGTKRLALWMKEFFGK